MTDDKQTRTYDLLIIGGGPAGLTAALAGSRLGKKTALVDDQDGLGGAGVNTGTLPSKTLRETALALSNVRARKLLAVKFSLDRDANAADFLKHEEDVKQAANHGLAGMLEEKKVEVFQGSAVFKDAHTISVRKRNTNGGSPGSDSSDVIELSGDKILIATGSSPNRPELFDFSRPGIYDSDTILRIERLPKEFAVIGSGVIGSEYASIFAALTPNVHVIDGGKSLLPHLDADVSKALTKAMEGSGVKFHWGERATACEVGSDGRITLSLKSGDKLTVDALLVTAGRKSNVDKLGVAAIGLELGDRGLIKVNDSFCTNIPHIYAAGDVIGSPALASTGAHQGRFAVRQAFAASENSKLGLYPTGVYTIPEVGSLGPTEKKLQDDGIDYVVGRADYAKSARGHIIGDLDGFLKLIFKREDRKLVGVHVIGEEATDLVHVGLMAMQAGMTIEDLDEACFNVPTLGELYSFGARAAREQL